MCSASGSTSFTGTLTVCRICWTPATLDMNQEMRESVVEFIAKWNGPGNEDVTMAGLLKFQAAVLHQNRQIKLVVDNRVRVNEFWGGVHGFPLLQKTASTVFASASYIAAAERNFPAHKFVHSQLRNRLKETNVEKLVLIFFNMKSIQPEHMDALGLLEDLTETDNEADSNNNQDSDFEYN
ncbi:hypothetical protein PF008_g18364 [Phytophthora fragariae]|uniref:HAT C-terminal dimerisation domain-containing protein n=1 Tax=Phytophthora fragariae TaxID=53985 RepID=A0A6G0R5U5_9STRA|nr:hypothetical protein PF008_g18364 [Phytophthora fragariae]